MTSLRRRLIWPAILLLALAAALWWRPAAEAPPRSRLLMGTLVEIRVLAPDSAATRSAIDAAFAEMARIEALMSPHLPTSDVSRLAAPVPPTDLAPETLDVIQAGIAIAEESGGAFDLGLGRLVALWGFAEGTPKVPSEAEIAAALDGVGPGDVTLVNGTVHKSQPDLQLDLGAIAKGYAVDRAAVVLQKAGIESATINAGGDIRLLGDRDGQPWRIGIQHPRQADAVLATLQLGDVAVVTSGDYERGFSRDGIRYHHLLDPRTGQPARGCQSVTVVAPSAMQADALATAAFVLGPQAGLALLERLPGIDGLIVAADGATGSTSGLQGKLTWR